MQISISACIRGMLSPSLIQHCSRFFFSSRRLHTRFDCDWSSGVCSSDLPGFRENDCVALVNKVLYELGSEHVEGVNAISGERCSPHPHVFTDRMLRPGDPAYFDILHAYN